MKKKCKKVVSYVRVSTIEQGISGLGLDAQRQAIQEAVKRMDLVVEVEFTEIASGKDNTRKELAKAIEYCKANNTGLIVAKLDRLGRNASYLFAIRDKVKSLYIADKPNMTTLEYGFYATMAQDEGERISQRTKAALAAKRESGYVFKGHPENLSVEGRQKSIQVRKEKAMNQDYNLIAKTIIKDSLGLTLAEIAKKLNDATLRTAKGKEYTTSTIQKLLKLYGLKRTRKGAKGAIQG